LRVITRGVQPGDYIYTATCENCQTTVEFARREAQECPDFRGPLMLKVNCPVCACSVYVETDTGRKPTIVPEPSR